MEAGIGDVSLGVLFGLELYRYEFSALLMHAEHLEAAFGVGPHAISVPRIKKADDINPDDFDNGIDDDIFAKITACIRIWACLKFLAVPKQVWADTLTLRPKMRIRLSLMFQTDVLWMML